MIVKEEQELWKAALERLRALDRNWPDDQVRDRSAHEKTLAECRAWIATRPLPRLSALANQLTPGVSRRKFWCALVPVERSVARCKITDTEILDTDLSADSPPLFPKMPVAVILDSLRSAFNAGGIFRTAECFGVQELVLCGYTPLPSQPQVAKAALGTEKNIAWRAGMETADELRAFRKRGIPCYALETVEGAPSLEDFPIPFPCALVLGNERFGLAADLLGLCDGVVRIPLYGRKNSLNVGSAFAISAQILRRKFMRKEGGE